MLAVVAAGCSIPPKPAADVPPPEPARITQFYASPPAIAPGRATLLCYGVENALEVRLNPAIEPIKPAVARCISVSPTVTSKYTLIAVGKDRKQASASTEITVSAKAAAQVQAQPSEEAAVGPKILFLLAPSPEIPAGFPVTICYGVKDAVKVTLSPEAVGPVEPKEKLCVTAKPAQTTTYTLTAADAAGRTAQEKLTIRVK